MTTGEYIRSLREIHNVTQQELAIACGATHKAVSTWEQDRFHPRRTHLVKMAEFFDVPIGTFIDESQRQNTMPFAEVISERVKDSGKTMTEVANDLGVPKQTLSAWCTGVRTPKPMMIEKVLEKLEGKPEPAPKEVIIVTQPEWKTLDYLTPSQVAKILQIGRDSAYELVRSLPHLKIGRQYRVSREAFEKYLNNTQKG